MSKNACPDIDAYFQNEAASILNYWIRESKSQYVSEIVRLISLFTDIYFDFCNMQNNKELQNFLKLNAVSDDTKEDDTYSNRVLFSHQMSAIRSHKKITVGAAKSVFSGGILVICRNALLDDNNFYGRIVMADITKITLIISQPNNGFIINSEHRSYSQYYRCDMRSRIVEILLLLNPNIIVNRQPYFEITNDNRIETRPVPSLNRVLDLGYPIAVRSRSVEKLINYDLTEFQSISSIAELRMNEWFFIGLIAETQSSEVWHVTNKSDPNQSGIIQIIDLYKRPQMETIENAIVPFNHRNAMPLLGGIRLDIMREWEDGRDEITFAMRIIKKIERSYLCYGIDTNVVDYNRTLFSHFIDCKPRPTMNESILKQITIQIVSYLEYLHSNNRIYKHLKPENIYFNIDSNDTYQIYFSSIAIPNFYDSIRHNGKSEALAVESMRYTHEFLAPEMITDLEWDFRIDWWGLGLLMYELIFGQLPWNSTTLNDLYIEILQFNPDNIDWDRCQVSKSCQDLITKLLQTNPYNRFLFDSVSTHPFFSF